jgi:hypothetical protein
MKKTHEFKIADKTMRKAHPDRFVLIDLMEQKNNVLGQLKIP